MEISEGVDKEGKQEFIMFDEDSQWEKKSYFKPATEMAAKYQLSQMKEWVNKCIGRDYD